MWQCTPKLGNWFPSLILFYLNVSLFHLISVTLQNRTRLFFGLYCLDTRKIWTCFFRWLCSSHNDWLLEFLAVEFLRKVFPMSSFSVLFVLLVRIFDNQHNAASFVVSDSNSFQFLQTFFHSKIALVSNSTKIHLQPHQASCSFQTYKNLPTLEPWRTFQRVYTWSSGHTGFELSATAWL